MPDGHPTDEWLRRVFTTPERAELTAAYDAWAGRYEADMLAVGYMHPFVAAGLVGRYVEDRSTPILDAGTGSGLLGQVLEILATGISTGSTCRRACLPRRAREEFIVIFAAACWAS